jgi:predicted AAA+ superfamily ATPase
LLGYKGAIFENLLADILGKQARKLYYYHKEGGLELDFLIRYNGECVPLECKAVSGRAKALQTVMGNPEKYHIFNAIKIGDYNIGRVDGILTIPHYLAFCIS